MGNLGEGRIRHTGEGQGWWGGVRSCPQDPAGLSLGLGADVPVHKGLMGCLCQRQSYHRKGVEFSRELWLELCKSSMGGQGVGGRGRETAREEEEGEKEQEGKKSGRKVFGNPAISLFRGLRNLINFIYFRAVSLKNLTPYG